ncbi:MAG: hypothetical protein M3Y43_00245 [Pseudomonadota bacterium]|nr:hypothetical protein [Pseudomonadota bacterium]
MADSLDAGCAAPEIEADGKIIDAEYITLTFGSPSGESKLRPPLSSTVSPPAPPIVGMDMLRLPAEAAASRRPSRGGPLFWAAGIGLAAAAFWISGGHSLVQDAPFLGNAPQSALRISGVTSHVDMSGLRPVLFVDGETANDGAAVAHLPPLDIAVTDNDGRVTRYRLGTAGRPMASGETFTFSSRLDVPKNGVKAVSVSFVE